MFKTRLILAILYTLAIFLALPMTGCAPTEYDIEAEVNPEEAGEVTGAGTYEENEEVILKAEPEEGYELEFKLLDSNLEEIETLSTLAPEPKITRKGVEVTSHNDKWLFGINGKVYSFDFK